VSAAPRTADDLLARYPEHIQELAAHARHFVRRVLPDINESVDAAAPLFGYGHGPGYRGAVATLILSQTGVKLGLVGGARMPDPRGLLEGTGKVHRYIQLRSLKDLEQPGISTLLKLASRDCRARLREAATAHRKVPRAAGTSAEPRRSR
jgi:hypothetical protein